MIHLQNVFKKFGQRLAVDDLSLEVPPGEIYGLLGHNGAGKSTAIGMMLGQIWPTRGEVRICGHDVTAHRPKALRAANALLDRFGYANRDAEGFRKAPDGKPLTIKLTLRSGAISREIQTLWKKNLEAVGLRTDFHVTPFQDAVKELERGQYLTYFGGFGGSPSGYAELQQLDSRQPPRVNITQFRNADYDRAAAEFLRSATSEGQIAAARRMTDIAYTYMPELPVLFRLQSNIVQPWVQGFASPVFTTYWKYIDIDLARGKGNGAN